MGSLLFIAIFFFQKICLLWDLLGLVLLKELDYLPSLPLPLLLLKQQLVKIRPPLQAFSVLKPELDVLPHELIARVLLLFGHQ